MGGDQEPERYGRISPFLTIADLKICHWDDLEFTTCLGPVAAVAGAVVTWLARLAMVARVVMGLAREAVTVPRLDTPAETQTH